jgi:vacuolar-type H+-ATPase subunit E/Vma4
MFEEADSAALLESLVREAEAERASIISQAQVEAAKIREQATQAAKAADRAGRERIRKEIDAARLRVQSRAELKAKALLLRTQHGVFEEVFRQARAAVEALTATPGYEAILRALIEEALRALGQGAVLEVRERDVNLGRRVVEELSIPSEIRVGSDVSSGVRGATPDGATVCLNGLDDRLAKARGPLMPEVARILWEQE